MSARETATWRPPFRADASGVVYDHDQHEVCIVTAKAADGYDYREAGERIAAALTAYERARQADGD